MIPTCIRYFVFIALVNQQFQVIIILHILNLIYLYSIGSMPFPFQSFGDESGEGT